MLDSEISPRSRHKASVEFLYFLDGHEKTIINVYEKA